MLPICTAIIKDTRYCMSTCTFIMILTVELRSLLEKILIRLKGFDSKAQCCTVQSLLNTGYSVAQNLHKHSSWNKIWHMHCRRSPPHQDSLPILQQTCVQILTHLNCMKSAGCRSVEQKKQSHSRIAHTHLRCRVCTSSVMRKLSQSPL